MRLLQPSSCQLRSRQSADDCDNNRVDNSSSDDHNDVDVLNFYQRDNCIDNHDCDDCDDHDVDCWRDDCYHNCCHN